MEQADLAKMLAANMPNSSDIRALAKALESIAKDREEIDKCINDPFHAYHASEMRIGFVGRSGVGKTSLINCIFPGAIRDVEQPAEQSNDGTKTTRTTLVFGDKKIHLFDLPPIPDFVVSNKDAGANYRDKYLKPITPNAIVFVAEASHSHLKDDAAAFIATKLVLTHVELPRLQGSLYKDLKYFFKPFLGATFNQDSPYVIALNKADNILCHVPDANTKPAAQEVKLDTDALKDMQHSFAGRIGLDAERILPVSTKTNWNIRELTHSMMKLIYKAPRHPHLTIAMKS